MLDRHGHRLAGLRGHDSGPGSIRGFHLVVGDIEQARAELLGRGVDIGPGEDVGGGVKYAGFNDPDGTVDIVLRPS